MLPSELALVKVKGHASGDELDAVVNRNADEMAKWLMAEERDVEEGVDLVVLEHFYRSATTWDGRVCPVPPPDITDAGHTAG